MERKRCRQTRRFSLGLSFSLSLLAAAAASGTAAAGNAALLHEMSLQRIRSSILFQHSRPLNESILLYNRYTFARSMKVLQWRSFYDLPSSFFHAGRRCCSASPKPRIGFAEISHSRKHFDKPLPRKCCPPLTLGKSLHGSLQMSCEDRGVLSEILRIMVSRLEMDCARRQRVAEKRSYAYAKGEQAKFKKLDDTDIQNAVINKEGWNC